MFEKESEEAIMKKYPSSVQGYKSLIKNWKEGAEFGYNKANEWHFVKDGDLPRQNGHTYYSIDVLANNKKWVYYSFAGGKWYCGNKEVKVTAWKEIVFPKESK